MIKSLPFQSSLNINVKRDHVKRFLMTIGIVNPDLFIWKIKNNLNPRFLKGYLAFHLARYISSVFPIGTYTSQLSMKVI